MYGPTRKISSRPITSGGSSRLHSTPASQTRGNGSLPRASIQASGVQNTSRTASVTPPDASEMRSGSSAPGPVSELTIALPDRCVSSAMTGPSSAIQITSAPSNGRQARGRAEAAQAVAAAGRPRPTALPGRLVPPDSAAAAAAGLAAQLTLDRGGDRAAVTEHRRREQREPALLVLGQAGRGQRVLDERGPGRGGLADRW